MSPVTLLLAFLGGVVPALVWLAFWLLEDRCQPEPKRYIILTFIGGMLGVVLVLPLERYAINFTSGFTLLFIWAALEELFKFAAAYLFALRLHVFDEPLDGLVYMVTAALGFSALENALFLWTPVVQGDLLRGVVTGDLRFMGAMLLHTLASATIGIALALSYNKPAAARKKAALVGLILAICLHTLFNFFILGTGGGATFWIFLFIWIGIIALLAFAERIKQPSKDYC